MKFYLKSYSTVHAAEMNNKSLITRPYATQFTGPLLNVHFKFKNTILRFSKKEFFLKLNILYQD